MTLAVSGKSRRRVSLLAVLAVLAVLAATVFAASPGGRAVLAQDGDEATDEASPQGTSTEGAATEEAATEEVTTQGAATEEAGTETAPQDGLEGGNEEGQNNNQGQLPQLVLSESSCPENGTALFHFLAPHAEEGAGSITVNYTIDGAAGSTTVGETDDANPHPDWWVSIDGEGDIVITGASAGSLVWNGHGSEHATIQCGEPPVVLPTGNLEIVKVVDNNDNPDFTKVSTDFLFDVTLDATVVVDDQPAGTFAGLDTGAYVVTEVNNHGYTVSFSGACDADGNVTVVEGQTVTCTVTNTAPEPNGNGGQPEIVLSESSCPPEGGALFHFLAPLASEPGGDITVTYTVDGGAEQQIVVNETDDANPHPDWHVLIEASGEITIVSAVAGDLEWLGHGSEHAVLECEPAGADQFTVTVIKWVDGAVPTSDVGAFDLTASWDATNSSNPGAGFQLTFDESYMESSPLLDSGYDYSVVENGIDGTCDPGDTYRLAGYTVNGVESDTGAIVDGTADGEIVVRNETCDQGPFNVTIGKFVDGVAATVAFDFLVTYDVVVGGNPLSATDEELSFTGTATSLDFEAGFDYSIQETGVDADCDDPDDVYQLLGYSVSTESLEAAAAMAPSMDIPSIVDGDDDYFIAVHNALCDEGPFNVTLGKFVDGVAATVAFDFLVTYDVVVGGNPLSATDEELSFTGTATSLDFEAGFDYSIQETGVDADCDDPDDVYQLLGYSISNISLAHAAGLEPSMTVPSIVDGDDDYFIAVHNALCGPVAGTSTVTIVKDAGGLANSTVAFTVSGLAGLTSFNLDDDTGTGNVSNTQLIPGLSGANFTVTEGLVAGWTLSNIVCTSDDDDDDDDGNELDGIVSIDEGARQVTFDIGENLALDITCTFFNEQDVTTTPTTPVTETPVTETPVTETPVTETPVTETPVTETPVTETPVTQTPTVTETTGAATPETPGDDVDVTQEAVAGATPMAPATGTGTVGERSATLGLLIAGLIAMTAGATLFAVRRNG